MKILSVKLRIPIGTNSFLLQISTQFFFKALLFNGLITVFSMLLKKCKFQSCIFNLNASVDLMFLGNALVTKKVMIKDLTARKLLLRGKTKVVFSFAIIGTEKDEYNTVTDTLPHGY